MRRLHIILFLLLLCSIVPSQAQPCQPVGNLIKSVSVLANPVRIRILWDMPQALPASGYIIYKHVSVNEGCNNPIDTLCEQTATSYTRNGFHEGGYTIAGYDGTSQPGTLPQHHVPPIINAANYDACNYTVSLSWSPYVGWNTEALYNVYAIIGGQTQQLAGNIATTSFVWQDAPDNTVIDFYVQAIRKDDATVVSDSPYKNIITTTPQRPAAIDLSRLIYDGNEVRLDFQIDLTTALTQFEIQRTAGADFETRYSFSDKTLATYTESADGIFRYRLVVKNDCGQIARMSDTLQNFVLDMTSQYDAWQLQWNPPASGEPYSFSLYRLNPDTPLITGITNTTFSDPITSVHTRQSLEYCYRLEALAPRGVSVSEACAFYKPRLAMPDAVDPLSTVLNAQTGRARNQFGPVLNVHPATYAYQLRIINRNGAKIADLAKGFNDDPLEKSWNGRFANGAAVPEEVYTYYLEVQFEGGRSEKRTGAVMVVYK